MDDIISSRIKRNPKSVIYMYNLNNEIINLALLNGYIPSKEDFDINPSLKDYKILVDKIFANDPSAIVFYSKKDLTKDVIFSAFNRNYIPSNEDLEKYPELCHNVAFMEHTISINPRLIVYVAQNCFLSGNAVESALSKYKITELDLQQHSNLRNNITIMSFLPEYELYSPFLSEYKKKIALKEALDNKSKFKVYELPFISEKYNGKCSEDKLQELLSYFKTDIKENIDNQKKYYFILDYIINGIINIRYLNEKKVLKYPDIITLYNKILEVFKEVALTNNFNLIENLAEEISKFTYSILSKEEISKILYQFYALYIKNNNISISVTSEFCNRILNLNRNMYICQEKQKIQNSIKYKLNLSRRKIISIKNGKKIKKIAELLKENNLENLAINKEDINRVVNKTKEDILNNKDIKKLGINIEPLALNKLINLFLFFGKIDDVMIIKLLNINNKEVIKYIKNKISKIIFFLSSNLNNDTEDINSIENKDNFPKLDYSNYLILEKDRYLSNIADIILKLDNDLLNKILENKDLLNDLVFLIPLLNLLDEFDINTFINIMCYYERIDYKLHRTNDYDNTLDIKQLLLKRIDDLITLGNAYASVDDVTLAALGSNVVNSIGDENSKSYLEFYIKMLNRLECNIPNVKLVTSDNYNIIHDDKELDNNNDTYYFESCYYSDPERLRIGGSLYLYSCIDLFNVSGKKTFYEILSGNNGNVILVKDKYKQLLDRIIVFRKGNVITMTTNYEKSYPLSLYKEIAKQIMQQAINCGDNIEYIFVNYDAIENNKEIPFFRDIRFKQNFLHADLDDTATLLVSKDNLENPKLDELNLDFDCEPKGVYYKDRKPINYSPSEEELTRIKALSIYMESDNIKKEYMKRKFEPIYLKEYKMAIAGEDWYILVRYDNTIEEVILPSNDSRTYEEIEYIRNSLLDSQSKGLM